MSLGAVSKLCRNFFRDEMNEFQKKKNGLNAKMIAWKTNLSPRQINCNVQLVNAERKTISSYITKATTRSCS